MSVCLCLPTLVIITGVLLVLFGGLSLLANELERRYERREVGRRLRILPHRHRFEPVEGQAPWGRCSCSAVTLLVGKE